MSSHRSKLTAIGDATAFGSARRRDFLIHWRAGRDAGQPLSMEQTIFRASLYTFVIAALWGAAYLCFLLSGVRWP